MTNTIADLTVTSDASKVAWGASCGKVSTGGFWNKKESEIHINSLELTAGEFALNVFQGQTRSSCPSILRQYHYIVLHCEDGRNQVSGPFLSSQKSAIPKL